MAKRIRVLDYGLKSQFKRPSNLVFFVCFCCYHPGNHCFVTCLLYNNEHMGENHIWWLAGLLINRESQIEESNKNSLLNEWECSVYCYTAVIVQRHCIQLSHSYSSITLVLCFIIIVIIPFSPQWAIGLQLLEICTVQTVNTAFSYRFSDRSYLDHFS